AVSPRPTPPLALYYARQRGVRSGRTHLRSGLVTERRDRDRRVPPQQCKIPHADTLSDAGPETGLAVFPACAGPPLPPSPGVHGGFHGLPVVAGGRGDGPDVPRAGRDGGISRPAPRQHGG